MLLAHEEFGQFPIQDDIQAGESGHGYVLRMAAANLLNGIPAVKTMLGKTRYTVFEASDAQRVASWFGADIKKLEQAFGMTATGKHVENMVFHGRSLNRSYFVNRMHPRVCIQCLEETGQCSASWEIALVTTCTRHGQLLQDSCPYCLKNLSWNRPSLQVCQCGNTVPYSDESPTPSALEIEFAKWVSVALDVPILTDKHPPGSSFSREQLPLIRLLSPLSLQGGLSLVQALGTAERCSRGDFKVCDRKKSSLLVAQETLRRASAFLVLLLEGDPVSLKASSLSVVLKLLGENAAAHRDAADRSLALSVLQKLVRYKGRSGWSGPYPHLSQMDMFT